MNDVKNTKNVPKPLINVDNINGYLGPIQSHGSRISLRDVTTNWSSSSNIIKFLYTLKIIINYSLTALLTRTRQDFFFFIFGCHTDISLVQIVFYIISSITFLFHVHFKTYVFMKKKLKKYSPS